MRAISLGREEGVGLELREDKESEKILLEACCSKVSLFTMLRFL